MIANAVATGGPAKALLAMKTPETDDEPDQLVGRTLPVTGRIVAWR